MQNIINFLIGLSVSVAAAMFAYAGFLYTTAGANPTQIGRAHNIFKNVLIGFLIAISAWLVVQTILSAVFSGSFWVGNNWFELRCVSELGTGEGQRLEGTSFGDILRGATPEVSMIPGRNTAILDCPDGYIYEDPLGACMNAEGDVVNPVNVIGDAPLVDSGGKCIGDCIGLPLNTSSSGCAKDPNGKCIVTRSTAMSLVNSCSSLASNGIGCTVTSAIGAGHVNPCHQAGSNQAGTCIDLVVSGCSMTSASCVKNVVNATQTNGCKAVFESQSQTTIDDIAAADPSLLSGGNLDQVSHATGNHFSVYCN